MTRPPSCLQCTSRHIQGGVDPRGDLFSCTRRGAAPIPVALFWGCYRCICDHVVCMSRCRCCRQCWCSSCVGCLLSSRNVYQLYATRGGCDEASERGSADYMDSVMSKTPPTGKEGGRVRRVGRPHRDNPPEQGDYADNCYAGSSHLVAPCVMPS